jgi:predicted ribosome quality control (RQC) complex YloA/Tae2 family protein
MSGGSLNWREIDLVLSELGMEGCLIQEVHQPSHDRIVLNLFRQGTQFSVLICLSARFPRMHILTEKLANPEKPLRFASFLRAHIRGGRIESAGQLRATAPGAQGAEERRPPPGAHAGAPKDAPGERIVRIAVRHAGEEKILWIRLWGAAANAILTDAEGIILDAFYRRPKKGEISRKPFDALAPAGSRPAKPGSRAAAPAAASEYASTRSALRPYAVRALPGEGSFNEKLEREFHDLETSGNVERLAAAADAELAVSENKVLASLESLTLRLSEYASISRFKELGDLVTSNLHAVARGQRWLKVEDFFHGNAPVEIELKPDLTPAQNAEIYYTRHRKARLGRGKVEEEIAHLQVTLEKIRRQRAAIASNPDPAALGTVARKAAGARKPLIDAGTPGLVFFSRSFRIIVGRTAKENDELLRRKVRGNDWWFHARDWPGAYVFVKAQPGKSLPLETMLDAATLAVHYSKGKTSGQGDVYYTQVKYLRRAKGAKKGTVLPTQEKNLHVKLDPARIERLRAGEEIKEPPVIP